MKFDFWRNKDRSSADEVAYDNEPPIDQTSKSFFQRVLPVFATGAGLFSDGYVQNVIGSVGTILGIQYGDLYTKSNYKRNVSSIAFAGTVLGQLIFGYTSDKWSRTNSLLVSTVILIIFTALCTGSYYHGSTTGMLQILIAWRFFVGIGIGGEYPAGSVGAAESTGELKSGTRNRWFILFTNSMIDWGFVAGALVPYIVTVICDNKHLSTIWRVSLGIGCVFPMILFVLRLRLKEPEEFQRHSMAHAKIPYMLSLRFYGYRLFVVSLIWFIYDFSAYSFGIYSSTILSNVMNDDAPLSTVFAWNILVNAFYLPGTLLGAPVSDWLGPRMALVLGVTLQAIVGFILSGDYRNLSQPHNVAGFAVAYGIFLSLGELGPGNNIGLLAAKTSATGIRGHYYGIAAAWGKVGAFVGTWVFPYIAAAGGDSDTASAQYPFYVSSSLCILSAGLTIFGLPHIGQETIQLEDRRFRDYLESKGYDTQQMGLHKGESLESMGNAAHVETPREDKQ